ncbi:hypothetical protein F2Q70_00018521 [Brassica cretica]|uniref:Uncharacterized protein n=1 Tax=Brassica cretica TaxID=69181 RepID=A0A8S9HRU0_BRACR|nr:hypothetical protein F2Q70_00018521 [Brassica cretica]
MKDPGRRMYLCFVARLSWVQNAKILCQDTGQKEMLQPTPRKAPTLEPSVRNSLQFGYQLNQLVGQAQPAGPTVSQLNSAGWSVWRLSWLDELGGGYESMVGSGADPVLFD